MKWMSLLCFGLALTLASVSVADEAKQNGKGKGKKAPSATQRFVGKIELTDAQKEQVAAIDKEFAEQFAALGKARTEILTADQIKAEKEATAANKSAEKSGPEARKAVEEALKLTDDQKAKMKEWQKSQTAFSGKIVAALKKILTPEQQEKLPKTASGEKKGAGKTKKKD